MVVDRLEDAVVVPAPSVDRDRGGDGRPRRRRRRARWPSAGSSRARRYEGLRVITKGLDSGASVIVDGLQMIRPGLAGQDRAGRADPAAEADGTKVTTAGAPSAPPRS